MNQSHQPKFKKPNKKNKDLDHLFYKPNQAYILNNISHSLSLITKKNKNSQSNNRRTNKITRFPFLIPHPDLNNKIATCPIQKQMKCLVSCVTQDPKFLPTTQCQVGLYFLSNYFLMQAAMSFSMLNFYRATFAQSIASCCISQFMSACLMTALRYAVDIWVDR